MTTVTMRHIARFGFAAALSTLLTLPGSASGQVVSASPTGLGMAGNNGALARGASALGVNPANLGLPDNPGWSLVFPMAGVRQGINPVSLGDITEYEGQVIPDSQKDAWMREIEDAGGQTGLGRLELSLFALSVGNFAFQVHSQGYADANLNPAAAELLLYGNAGRTGTPGDFSLDGSALDGSGTTTFALGGGVQVAGDGDPGSGILTLGANLTYSVGNLVGIARDAGSLVTSDPLEVDVAFPVIHTSTDEYDWNGGTGVGLDLGAAWMDGPLTLGASLANVFNTFEFTTNNLVYRPLDLTFTEDGSSTDTDTRPIAEAPQSLLNQLAALKFKPTLTVSSAYRALDNLAFAADFVQRFGDGIPTGAKTRLGVGLDWQAIPIISVQAGLGYVTEGITAGFGSALTFGAFNIAGAYQMQRGDVGDANLIAVGLSFNTR